MFFGNHIFTSRSPKPEFISLLNKI
jgi:hypothetical protein